MKIKALTHTMCVIVLLSTGLAGCMGSLKDQLSRMMPAPGTPPAITATSNTTSIEDYKRYLAQRIVAVNSTNVYIGHPQALLRAVIVLKFYVDADGKLLRTEVMRTNNDHAAETVALSSVKNAAPFPKPESQLLRRGEIEISESWLFNNDGRFQLRTLAEAQMGE
ncbi:energy transducer TonB family protein [Glaciimonas sp. GG7]